MSQEHNTDPARMFAALGAYMADRGSTTTSANVEIRAGGVGVWFCATAAAVCFVSALFLGAAVFYLAMKVEDQGHQLNAIYMIAPQLRPEAPHK